MNQKLMAVSLSLKADRIFCAVLCLFLLIIQIPFEYRNFDVKQGKSPCSFNKTTKNECTNERINKNNKFLLLYKFYTFTCTQTESLISSCRKKDKIKQKVNKTHGKNNKISARVLEKSASKCSAWKVKEIENDAMHPAYKHIEREKPYSYSN